MKIACVTTHNIQNSLTWPAYHQGLYGASRKITQVLEGVGCEISYLGPLKKPRSPITRLKWLSYRHLFSKDYYSWGDPIVLNSYARQIESKMRQSDADLILCPENPVPIAHLRADRPLVLWTDTTIASLVDFYSYLCNLCPETRRNIYRLEKAALERCSLIILTSDWAAQFATRTYGIPPKKIHVIPRGSNNERSLSVEDVKTSIEERPLDTCTLTFVGVDWDRKGGDVALSVAERLNERGLPTTLQIIGCQPKRAYTLPSFVKPLGFLHRANPDEFEIFESALCKSHFLILPSRAEHCAIALSEANSYGVPCLTTDVGGIPTIVQGGRNGSTFKLNSDIDDYCEYVMKYMSNPNQYRKLALSSLQEFETRLSWNVAKQKAKELLERIVG
jgi:glycosyltransferase involved in cell wall biosynthesis